MHGKNLVKRFLVLVLLCTSFCFYFTGNDNIAFSASSTNCEIPNIFTEDYDVPIYIDEDSDFDSYGFPGNGSQSNPYTIENKHFMSVETYNGIEIHNTTKYFIIRDCTFDNMGFGIEIVRVANHTAIVANNEFKNSIYATILVRNTSYARVENNTGTNDRGGIGIKYCSNLFICNNYYYGGMSLGRFISSGISVLESNQIIVRNNSINNFNKGIHIWRILDCLIEENTIVNTRFLDSIYLISSTNNVFRNNFIYNNLYADGIECYQSSENTFVNNTIYHCADAGIRLAFQSYNNSIYHNNLINNTRGSYQGYDYGGANNIWYNETLGEGNYWSNWDGEGVYLLGTMNNDSYPLDDLMGISENDIFVPITYYDDHLEENDFIQNAPTLIITQKHELHYADIDIYKISLTEGVQYYFSMNFNLMSINLDFYLLNGTYYYEFFKVLAGSENTDDVESFIYTPTLTGDYYILVVGDLEHYTTIVPSNYQLKYYSEITSLSGLFPQTLWIVLLLLGVTTTLHRRSFGHLLRTRKKK